MADPRSVFAETPSDFAHRHINRVPGHADAIPRLGNHLLVVDALSAVEHERLEDVKRLGTEPDIDALPNDARGGEVDRKRSKAELSHCS